ncbi:MAG: HXXEE domain-containing protein [Pseudomonadota bacterium]
MTKYASLACLICAFGMLWLPLGQHHFLFEHWMKLGTFMAPFLLLIAFAFGPAHESSPELSIRLFSLWLLIAYIAHQFEEHWVDLYGSIYAFKPFLNAMLLERLGGEDGASPPLSDAGVFVINTSLVWLVAGFAIWRGASHVFPALCMASIVLVNAISHIGAAVSAGAYNPGLLTAAVVFIPLSIWVYVRLVRSGAASGLEAAASLLWGFLGHVVMILGIIASGWWMVVPELLFFAVLIAWSISPVFIFRSKLG